MKKTSVLTILLLSAALCAKNYYVAPDAKPGGDGSKDKPFAKIQTALDKAMPGDTVELAPGVYYERVTFPRSGEYKKPIRLNGPRTAIIDGSEKFQQKWEKCPEYGPLAWKTPVPTKRFASASALRAAA